MTPELFAEIGISSALGLLPPRMDTPDARALLMAIALQESELKARRQFGGGPARSYFQFELGGIEGVLSHQSSGRTARALCVELDIGPTGPAVYQAIEFNDVLACGFARLLLWTLPTKLPSKTETVEALGQYLAAWRPGKPRLGAWPENFTQAWAVTEVA